MDYFDILIFDWRIFGQPSLERMLDLNTAKDVNAPIELAVADKFEQNALPGDQFIPGDQFDFGFGL